MNAICLILCNKQGDIIFKVLFILGSVADSIYSRVSINTYQ